MWFAHEEGLERYLFRGRGIQIFIAPYLPFARVSMAIESGRASLNEVFKPFTTAERVLEDREFGACHGPQVGGAHGGRLGL